MIVYVDLLILSTIIVNYLFIKTIAVIFHEKLSLLRTILALILSCLMLLLYYLPYHFYFIIRYFMGIIIGFIAFPKSDPKIKIIKIIIFYLLNMMFIGSLVVFKVQNMVMLLVTVFVVIIAYLIQNYQNTFKKGSINETKVYLNKQILNGYYDSGNFANYNNIPIVFLKRKYYNLSFTLVTALNIKTINSNQIMNVYQGAPLIIKKKAYQVYYIFVDEINYDIILNNFDLIKKGKSDDKIN